MEVSALEIIVREQEFILKNGTDLLLHTDAKTPMVYVGCGEENVQMYRGNFKIDDYVVERRPLTLTAARKTEAGAELDLEGVLTLQVTERDGAVTLTPVCRDGSINRFWLRVQADAAEHVYGCGEQMSYFDLRGRHFPLWTSEPGVGRDKTTYVTWRSDVENGGAGGDYYHTNYPQPTYVSSRHYYLHMQSTAYSDFDFRHDSYHELQTWCVPDFIRLEAAPTFIGLLEKLTAFLGRQPELPDWIYNGLIIGAQGGNERSFGIVDKSLAKGIKVAGVWCQDWCGKRVTSFGKRLQWDWHFHKEMYPDLPRHIEELHKRGIKFLGYINPYLVNDGALYEEGKRLGVFAKKSDGSDYLVDFGEFYCGVVDFTDPKAYQWFKDEVIKKYSIDIGIDGWMADFGEYLPTDDLVLANGVSPMIEHNRWPVRWAQCNYDAVKESGKLGQVVYFMRAGVIGTGYELDTSRLWRAVMHRLKDEYPDVAYSEMFVDNCAMQIVKDPAQFDVIVTENMFGDILSDEASMITGSIGMIPSSSLGDGTRGLYEPIHGSAPDIAGQDKVNPTACILSAAMMLRYSFGMAAEADCIEAAVGKVLDKGLRTADNMSEGCTCLGCAAMGDAILAEM